MAVGIRRRRREREHELSSCEALGGSGLRSVADAVAVRRWSAGGSDRQVRRPLLTQPGRSPTAVGESCRYEQSVGRLAGGCLLAEQTTTEPDDGLLRFVPISHWLNRAAGCPLGPEIALSRRGPLRGGVVGLELATPVPR